MMPKARICKTESGWEVQIYDRCLASVTYRAVGISSIEQALALTNLYRASFLATLANRYIPFAAKFQVN